jgi:hypothetical protein
LIFVNLADLPGTWELVKNLPGDIFTNTLAAIFPHDEKLCHHPGVFLSGQVIVSGNQNKACQVAIDSHKEGSAFWLNPIVIKVWIIEEP